MAGTASKDSAGGDGSSPSEGPEGMSMGQNCQAGDLLAEWRSCEQVDNDTPSTSPPYWDTDDEDDNGPKPSELYGKFTWKIDDFSKISKRELRSNAFEVGGYKWYILIYPQGCDVCNHLSLFLCVANHDRLLPGWSHFAQFTIAVVNKDPKKSKYSDTLHRFWKKEHDWGWKKFMELSKIVDGFIDADTLVIKAQVQVIREKANRPFRCLDRQYRRELVRVYLSNVENICRRFIEERRGMLSKLIEDRVSWSGFRLFWLGVDQNARRRMSRDKTDAILKVIVKHFFVEKEVTSTLVMDSLYSGLKALEWQSESKRGTSKSADIDEMPTPIVDVENGIFFLADDALVLLERTALEPLPPKDDKGSQNQSQSQNQNQNRTKDGNSTEEFSKDSVERDEKRLTELGRRTLEIFVLTHIFSSKIEVAYQEVVAFQRQEELIREEEAAEQAELELRAKRLAAEKEKRAKKRQSKQKRNNRKGKEKDMPTKPGLISNDISLKSNSPDEKILEDFSAKSEEIVSVKVEVVEDASDMSDSGVDTFSIDRGLDDRVSSLRNWEVGMSTCSAVNPGAEASISEVQNDQLGKKGRSAVDDSSSTCSTDSIPSVVSNTGNRANLSQNNKDVPPNSRGRNRRNKATRHRSSQTSHDTVTLPSDATLDAGHVQDTTDHSRTSTPESEAALRSNGHAQLPQPDLPDKQKEGNSSFEDKQSAKVPVTESTQQPRKVNSSPSAPPLKHTPSSQQLKQSSDVDSAESLSTRESRADVERQVERVVPVILKSRQNMHVDKPESQKLPMSGKAMNSTTGIGTSSVSRPLSAPLIPEAKPAVPIVSTVQTSPLLSRSASAFGRLGATESPSSSQSYAPLSYRNAIIGKSTSWSNSSGYAPDPPSSSRGSLYSQPAASVVTASCTDSVLSGPEQSSMRPGLTFGSVAPKPSVSGNRAPAGRFVQESGRNIHPPPAFTRNAVSSYTEELVSEHTTRQVQCSTADEFPHLDIINYVLDEDYMDANMSTSGRNCLLPNWQYGFPGNLAGAEAGPSSSPCHFNGPDQYYGDANGMYDLYHLDGGRDLLSLDVDSSPAYTSSEMDGWMGGANQWHPGGAPNSLLNVGSSTECSPLPYQLQDYSNLACGVSGYTMYPPTNGF